MIRNTILDIAEAWPTYRSMRTTDKTHPTHKLITEIFPSLIRDLLPPDPKLKFKGSAGQTNITAAPWIATFDKRVSTGASEGFYAVYLFSIDLQRVYLKIAFGTTQFTDFYGENSSSYKKIEDAARRLQTIHTDRLLESWQRGPIDLAAQKKHKLHRAYEHSSISSIRYQLGELPAEQKLVDDYRAIISVYQQLVESPLTPSMSALLEESAPEQDERSIEAPVAIPFTFRPKVKTIGRNAPFNGQRFSSESHKVGRAGESAVLKYERERLSNIGRPDLARKIVWESDIGNKPGWDLTSFDQDEEEIFIEVKSTIGKTLFNLDLTKNEWTQAKLNTDRYYLYIVTEALKDSRKIEILKNPAKYVSDSQLDIEATMYRLSLREN